MGDGVVLVLSDRTAVFSGSGFRCVRSRDEAGSTLSAGAVRAVLLDRGSVGDALRDVRWLRRRRVHLPVVAAVDAEAVSRGVELLAAGVEEIVVRGPQLEQALLARLAVDQSTQGQGLGAALLVDALERCLTLAEALGVHAVEVDAIDSVAKSFYEKYGFNHVGTRKNYYLDNREDAVIMTTDDIKSDSYRELLDNLRRDLRSKLNHDWKFTK